MFTGLSPECGEGDDVPPSSDGAAMTMDMSRSPLLFRLPALYAPSTSQCVK